MKITESQLRKIIRQELLKENNGMKPQQRQEEPEEKGKIYPGAIAGGVGVAGALAGINALLMHIQTSDVGAEIAKRIGETSAEVQEIIKMLQNAMEE